MKDYYFESSVIIEAKNYQQAIEKLKQNRKEYEDDLIHDAHLDNPYE